MTQRAGYKANGTLDLRRMPKIIRRPLGREQAHGMAAQLLHSEAGGDPRGYLPDWGGEPTLWLDPSLDGTRAGLETAIHEALHLACPFMFEKVVTQVARYLAMVVWRLGYRLPDVDI
jgi:hypothetical protein